jgi:hypothetical protein
LSDAEFRILLAAMDSAYRDLTAAIEHVSTRNDGAGLYAPLRAFMSYTQRRPWHVGASRCVLK